MGDIPGYSPGKELFSPLLLRDGTVRRCSVLRKEVKHREIRACYEGVYVNLLLGVRRGDVHIPDIPCSTMCTMVSIHVTVVHSYHSSRRRDVHVGQQR